MAFKNIKADLKKITPTVHPHAMCSTVILRNLSIGCDDWSDRDDAFGGFREFRDQVSVALEWLGSQNHYEYHNDQRQYDYNKQWFAMIPLPEYKANQYAHCMASTDEEQRNVRKYFRKLGFESSKSVHNSKNETHCKLFWIPMKTLLKNLEIKP